MAANLKISQLNAAETLTGAELIECVQDGANVQTTATALAGLAQSTSGTATDGYVLTADGAGGAAWEEPSGGGSAGLSIAFAMILS